MSTWLSQRSRIWPHCDINRRQRPMRALISFTFQKNLRINMRRMRLLGYSRQPGACSCWPAGFISIYTIHLIYYIPYIFPSVGHTKPRCHPLQSAVTVPRVAGKVDVFQFLPVVQVLGQSVQRVVGENKCVQIVIVSKRIHLNSFQSSESIENINSWFN